MGLLLFIYYNLTQQYYELDVEASDTIQLLSQRINTVTSSFPALGTLYHNNELLIDLNLTLSDYGIQKFHTVVFQNPLPSSIQQKANYVPWIISLSILSFFLFYLILKINL
jgi:ABC-type multidrug transport system permease subunit